MTPEISLRPCSKPGCNPEQNGDCVEGLGASDCPHRHSFVVPDDSEDTSTAEFDIKIPDGSFRVHNGDAFTTAEADEFLRKNCSIVVAFVGCPGAGKTTAAVMLYELLKRGRLPSLGFAGSRTIRGFQSRSYKSLLSSGLVEPVTDRTRGSAPVEFLHLLVTHGNNKRQYSNLLLADRTGEDFVNCISKPDLCGSYPEIPRADCHVLLVDGNKLVNDELAALHLAQVRRIFISLIRTPLKRLQIILTKYDKVISSQLSETVTQQFEDLLAEFVKRSKGKFVISSLNMAARPSAQSDDGDYLGLGVEEMVAGWFPKSSFSPAFLKYIPKISSARPYDMLLNTIEGR